MYSLSPWLCSDGYAKLACMCPRIAHRQLVLNLFPYWCSKAHMNLSPAKQRGLSYKDRPSNRRLAASNCGKKLCLRKSKSSRAPET
jgi:hypothetical protein